MDSDIGFYVTGEECSSKLVPSCGSSYRLQGDGFTFKTSSNVSELVSTLQGIKRGGRSLAINSSGFYVANDTSEAMNVVIRGITVSTKLPIKNVVIVGASLMFSCFGQDLTTPNASATSLFRKNEGMEDINVYGYAFSGETLGELALRVETAVAAFDPRETLFLFHGSGNSITATRPFVTMTPTEKQQFSDDMDSVFEAFVGTNHIMADTTFRSYADPNDVFGAVYFNDEGFGSEPYNVTFNHPKILIYTPSYVNTDGRSVLDFYNLTRTNFRTYLQSDGLLLTQEGKTGLIDFIADRIQYIFQGKPMPAPLIPAPKDNTIGVEAKSTFSFGARDSSLKNSENVDLLKYGLKRYLLSDTGVETPYIYSMEVTDPLKVGNTIDGGRLVNIPTYVGDIYCDPMLNDSCYVQSTETITHKLEGLTPNVQYTVGLVASRDAVDERISNFDFGGGTVVSINTTQTPPEATKNTIVTSDNEGVITFVQSALSGTFSYLGAFSLEKV